MKISKKRSLDYDDVCLVPRVISEINSRDDIKVNINFAGFNLTMPIIASPMKDVCDGNLAKEIRRLGGLGLIHRFNSIPEQIEEYKKCPESGCAIGINGDYLERFLELYKNGCRLFCVDIANGATSKLKSVIDNLCGYLGIHLIVGNVASKECYEWLEKCGIVGIRVGIAGGAGCTTKNATGVYHGMASCIMECTDAKQKSFLIADGGIKSPADFCKAIAFGADLVMMGSVIAVTKESPAQISDDSKYKIYNGSASLEIQKIYKEFPKYIEGTTRLLEYHGQTLEIQLSKYMEGLKSSMSYFNAKNLNQYRKNISFKYV